MEMTNQVLDGITIALHGKFGDTFSYYVENIEQHLDKPCFVVKALNPLVKAKNQIRYHWTIPVVVHFFTDKEVTEEAKKDNYNIAGQLLEALEYITVDGNLTRGEDIEFTVVDDVLQFFITYNFFTFKEKETIYMENGTVNGVPIP